MKSILQIIIGLIIAILLFSPLIMLAPEKNNQSEIKVNWFSKKIYLFNDSKGWQEY